MTNNRSFGSDASAKAEILSKLRNPAEAGQLRQHASLMLDYTPAPISELISKIERYLWIPDNLVSTADYLFSVLSEELALAWPERFIESIPIDVDLRYASQCFNALLLSDEELGVIRFAQSEEMRVAVSSVASLCSTRGHIRRQQAAVVVDAVVDAHNNDNASDLDFSVGLVAEKAFSVATIAPDVAGVELMRVARSHPIPDTATRRTANAKIAAKQCDMLIALLSEWD